VKEFLNQLNIDQRTAVEAVEGPVMVIAGAGSGKTRVLTYRIAHLLSIGVDPFNVLALTFTNKAAKEMKERIMELIGDSEGRNVWMGTFHSIFAKILRIEGHQLGYPSNYSIYDSDDSKRLIRNIIKEMDLDNKIYSYSYVASRISMAKSSLVSPEDYANSPDIIAADESARKPEIKNIYRTYNMRLRRADAMDFDDLLFNTYLLFSKFAATLLKYQRKFRYIMVDEYQDTNQAQYLILKKLAANTENICVVGDDAQSIYGFRGANISNMLNFKHDYPDYKLYKLEQNYRSTKNIVEAANQVISYNKNQIEKKVWTQNVQGDKIGYIHASSDTEEGNLVANSIFEHKMNKQLPNSDFAILYRTNAQSRSMEEALRKMNIPYKIYGGLSFYNRKEIKDLLAYYRLVINHNDEDSLQRTINTPARGIGKTTMEKITVAADEYGVNMWEVLNDPGKYKLNLNTGLLTKLRNFTTLIKSFAAEMRKKDAYEAARHIAVSSGILKMYRDDDAPEAISRVENIDELLNGIKEFIDKGAEESEGDLEKQGTLEEFMQDVALLTNQDNEDEEDKDKVTLMTIHSAKGLEFPYVYVVGLEENLFPSIQSISTRSDLEEERRLFYVAITRAETLVTLSFAESRYRWGQFTLTEPSRFLEEIDESLVDMPRRTSKNNAQSGNLFGGNTPALPKRNMKSVSSTSSTSTSFEESDTAVLQTGMKVEHPKFGKGKVTSVEGSGPNKKATVFFNGVGQKSLLLRFAKLKILS
jgi:DNA helicase-2/ATP-dependent DNA helicase PcrA